MPCSTKDWSYHDKQTKTGTDTVFVFVDSGFDQLFSTPAATNATTGINDRFDLTHLPPFSQGHLFGTDNLGRDLASMLWTGALGTMAVALTAALSAAFFGYLFGAVSALIGGIVDNFLMRLVDALLSIPSIILLLTISALITAPEFTKLLPDLLLRALSVSSYSDGLLPFFSVVAAIAATGWLESARVARALVLKLKEEDYFVAAQSPGAGPAP
ncbi:MAG: ABC transporter permease [Candidatus Obscuribacter sp.]|nr:ABC transporter permease [Candidatus Obscuribacter sp.]